MEFLSFDCAYRTMGWIHFMADSNKNIQIIDCGMEDILKNTLNKFTISGRAQKLREFLNQFSGISHDCIIVIEDQYRGKSDSAKIQYQIVYHFAQTHAKIVEINARRKNTFAGGSGKEPVLQKMNEICGLTCIPKKITRSKYNHISDPFINAYIVLMDILEEK